VAPQYTPSMSKPTHIACLDESFHNQGRFRSLSVASVPVDRYTDVSAALASMLIKSGIESELKWTKVKTARGRFAAAKLVDLVADWVDARHLRVDTLTWDTEDSRHAIEGRDDAANIGRMHYHLLRNSLGRRWGVNTRWLLYPDESSVDWQVLGDCLHFGERRRLREQPQVAPLFEDRQNLGFTVHGIEPKAQP
jgi:hypothetical protein